LVGAKLDLKIVTDALVFAPQKAETSPENTGTPHHKQACQTGRCHFFPRFKDLKNNSTLVQKVVPARNKSRFVLFLCQLVE
jgi:hypothetical protein